MQKSSHHRHGRPRYGIGKTPRGTFKCHQITIPHGRIASYQSLRTSHSRYGHFRCSAIRLNDHFRLIDFPGSWQTPSLGPTLQQRSSLSNFSTVAVLPVSDDVPLSQFSHELFLSLGFIGKMDCPCCSLKLFDINSLQAQRCA